MRDQWSTEVQADAPQPDEAFKSALRAQLLAAWHGDVHAPGVAQARRSRRWTIAAAAVAAIGLGAFVIVRTAAAPRAPAAPSTSPGPVVTPADVLGTWVVTETDGIPRPAPLPTYRFKIGTGPAGVGVVTGFDGCDEVAGTWALDRGRIAVTLDTGGGASWCPYAGTVTPLVPLTDAVLAAADGELVMRLGESGAAIARRLDGLSPPAALAGTAWTVPEDGPDLTLSFARDELTLAIDGSTCARASYSYDGATLRIGPALASASGPCAGSLLAPLANAAVNVVEYTDGYSASLLVPTPAAGTVRIFPDSRGSATATSAPPDASPPRITAGDRRGALRGRG